MPSLMQADQPARETQISGQMAILDSVLEDVNAAAINLSQRLHLVTRANAPTAGESNKPKVAEALVPLAEHIRMQIEKLRTVTAIIQDIGHRLEV